MGLWSRLFRWSARHQNDGASEPTLAKPAAHAVELPLEPFVFECQSCGKVFEARRRHPSCPECESRDVSMLAE